MSASYAWEGLPVPVAQRLDAICRRFEAAWKEPDPTALPTLEPYLADVAEPEQVLLRQELLRIEDFHRRRLALAPCSADTVAVEPSERLLGQYRLLERLGGGGMGEVFRAHQGRLDRVVALKIIRPELLVQSQAVERFRHEARILARLQHPNVVIVHDIDEADGTHFLVMEYVPGIDLQRRVERDGPLPTRSTCEYVRQAALGLQHAHEKGLVHRDVKPANLLVTPEGVVKVLDLGLARLLAPSDAPTTPGLTREGTVIGTPDYMAPEQATDSRGVDIRADLYGLGCTLYFLLAGRPPFPDGTLLEKLEKHRTQQPPSLRKLRLDLPPDVERIVSRLLAKRPSERYQTPAELAEALGRVLEYLPSEPIQIRTFRPPWVSDAALLGAGVLLVAVVVGWFLFGPRSSPSTGPTSELSVLERLDPKDIPPEEQFAGQPVELVAVLGQNRARHWGDITGLAVGPNRLATAGTDGAVRFWSADTLREDGRIVFTRNMERAANPVGVAFAPDGSRCFVAAEDALQVWDATTLRTLATFRQEGSGWLTAVVVAPEGDRVVCAATSDALYLWDLPDGKRVTVLKGHGGDITGLAFSPMGDRIVSASIDRTVRVWDVRTGQQVSATEELPKTPRGAVFLADGRVLFGSDDGSVRAWDPGAVGPPARWTGHTGPVTDVAVSVAAGRAASAGHDGTVRLWDPVAGKEVASLTGPPGVVRHIAFSPDGSRVYATAEDGVLRGWDTRTGEPLRPLRGHTRAVRGLAFFPDGRRLLTSGADGSVRVWDLSGQEQPFVALEGAGFAAACLAPTGDRFAAAVGPEVRLCDTATGKLLRTFKAPSEGRRLPQRLQPVFPDPPEPRPDDRPPPEFRAYARFESVAFSPTGDSIVAGSANIDGILHLWGYDSDERLEFPTPEPTYRIHDVAFGERHIAAGGSDGLVRLWDVGTGREVFRLGEGREGAVQAVAFTSDGGVLSGGVDGTVRLWRLRPKGEERRYVGPTGSVLAVAVSADGKQLAAAGVNGELIVWERDADRPRHRWVLPGRLHRVAFAPDGRHLATANGNGSVYVFRLPSHSPVP